MHEPVFTTFDFTGLPIRRGGPDETNRLPGATGACFKQRFRRGQ